MLNIKKDALIIYKGQPGKVVETGKKIEIKLNSGEGKSVRDKDILVIHKGPVKSLNFSELDCDINEIWTLLQGEQVTLSELAEYLFNDDSAESTYNAYLHLEKNLYFKGNINSIECNTSEFVDAEIEKVESKNRKVNELKESMVRLSKGVWTEDDEVALREIESLALEQRTGSKVLKTLGIKESSIDAHRFLIRIGYWSIERNPYPGRMVVSLNSTVKKDDYEQTLNPVDLTHLKSYAIDDEGSTDPDDAISFEGNKVWIHITDVASIIKAGTIGDSDASSKGSNLYLPTQTVHMLPKEVTEIQALGRSDSNNTLSYEIEFDDEYNIVKREIHLARVKIERFTYAQVEEEKDSERFKPLYHIAEKLKQRRDLEGALSISLPEVRIRVLESNEIDIKPINGIQSRNVVSEFMLLAGETAAIFCNEKNIPIPYATQLPPDTKGVPDDNLASMFMWRRKFKRGETKFKPEPHSGLGFKYYARATSPLRRYSDLVVNQQIRSFLLGEPIQDEDEVLMKVAPAIESIKKLTVCERASNLHWKLVYLNRHKDDIYTGTYVEKKDKSSGTFIIEDLALEIVVPMAELPELNEKIQLKIKKIDIPICSVTFIPC